MQPFMPIKIELSPDLCVGVINANLKLCFSQKTGFTFFLDMYLVGRILNVLSQSGPIEGL